jgi:uncharacterized protein (UPF0332 family)
VSGLASPIDRAREELRAARALMDAGFPAQALSRAYTAALRTAEAALLSVNEVPATPAGVVSAFSRRVVIDGEMDTAHARALRRLYEDRRDVDHGLAEVPDHEATRAIGEADALLEAATRWIDGRLP